RSRGDEALGRQRSLRNSKQERLIRRRLPALGLHPGLLHLEEALVDLLPLEEVRIARVLDPDLLQHLPDDDLDVLVVDPHALESVDLLDLVHQVFLHRLDYLDLEDVVRVDRSLGEAVAGVDVVPLLDVHVLALGDQVLARLARVPDHDQLLHASGHAAELHAPVDLADGRGVLRLARFEELGHAGQTARDVAGLRDLAADLDQRLAGRDLVAVAHEEPRPGRERIARDPAVPLADDVDVRMEHLLAVVDDDHEPEARVLVDLVADGNLLLDIDESHDARLLGENRRVERVPLEELAARIDLDAVAYVERGAVRRRVALTRLAVRTLDLHLALVADHDQLAAHALDRLQIAEDDLARSLRLDLRLLDDASGHAADVERTERELRAGLADRLRRDDARGLAQVDHAAGRQVASVAFRARAARRLALEDGANRHLLDAPALLDRLGHDLVDLLAGTDETVARVRIHDVLDRHASEHPVAERLDDLLALLEGADLEAVDRAAILDVDDHVLRHVHEAPREIAGVRRLERRVREALPGAVRGHEVLEHGEAFLEVVDDRRLDDLAQTARDLLLRLGHEAAHPGELADLLLRSARAGVGHHEDRIEAVPVGRETAERLLLDLGRHERPGVDDLVVPLA